MIFNPLFLSENSINQLEGSKQTKMSKSKYLFSDIVKVVMNPVNDTKDKMLNNNSIIGNNLGLALDNTQQPVQLKLKFLSDIDNEKAKMGLAEILPIEIAQLLMTDESINDEEKAVSYISKEPLAGEVQNFINNLIGPEIIDTHLNSKSGLLLSLEDSKSAVNLELVQVPGNKSVSDNVLVQTLVVPEKSKLLSLVKDIQNKNGLFRIDNSNIQNLNENHVKSTVNALSDGKPTLSVYSFNYGGDKFESLTKNIKVNTEISQNLSKLNGNESKNVSSSIKNLPLEKISFIPSELKTIQQSNKLEVNGNTNNTQQQSELKLVKNNIDKSVKDFSISKITIVKKSADNSSNDTIVKNEKNIKFDGELKRIDFNNVQAKIFKKSNSDSNPNKVILPENNSKINKPQSNIDSNIIKNIKSQETSQQNTTGKELKIENQKNIISPKKNDIPLKQSKIIEKNVTEILVKNPGEKIKTATKLNTISVEEQKTHTVHQKDLGEPKIGNNNSDKVTNNTVEKNSSSKNNPLKVNDFSKIHQQTNSATEKNTESPKLEIDKTKDHELKNNSTNSKPESFKSTDISAIKPEKEGLKNNQNQKEMPNEVKSEGKQIVVNKSEVGKSESLNTKSFNAKLDDNLTSLRNVERNEYKTNTKSDEVKVENKTVKDEGELAVANNKKISVKVKNEVKSINEKQDTSTSESKKESENKSVTSKDTASNESNNSNEFKNSFNFNSQSSFGLKTENSFQQVMDENNVIAANDNVNSKTGLEKETKQNVVKSVEILKEVTKFISKQEKGSLSFDIKPEQLGKMKITLDTADNILRARIEVDSEQAKQIIERNLDKLHEELAENGIQLNSLNISLSNSKQEKENEDSMRGESNKSQNQGQVGEAEEEDKKKSMGYNTYEYIA